MSRSGGGGHGPLTYSAQVGSGPATIVPHAIPPPAPGSVCFYLSKVCPYCVKFLTEIQKTPYVPEFKFVCVDRPTPGQPRPPLPPFVTKVPTLKVDGEAEPRVEFVQCMNWLFERKQRDSSARSTGSAALISGGAGITPASLSASVVDPEAWSHDMGCVGESGFSDFNLTYTGVSPKDATLPHSGRLEAIGGGPGLGPGPGPSVGAKQSAKSAAFESQYAQFMKNRDIGIPSGPGRM